MQIFTENTESSAGVTLLGDSLNITPGTLIVAILTLVFGYIIAKILVRWMKGILRKQGRMNVIATGLIERIISILLYGRQRA